MAMAVWGVMRAASRPALPRIALIIDDFGYAHDSLVARFAALGIPLTVAILPYQEFSVPSAESAHRAGLEVLLHLPMEGGAGRDPGPDALLGALSEVELRARTRKALGAVPHIAGANNHMGSALTADSLRMRWVLEELGQDARLFFVDSRTTEHTAGASVAHRLGLTTASRNVFLDNDKSTPAITREWRRALVIAERTGQAIVIGHVYPETLTALRTLVPAAKGRVEFVPVGALVR